MRAVQHEILQHGEAREAPGDLEGAHEPAPRHPVRPPACDVIAVEDHLPRLGGE
jgi:hypothetical protein